MDRRAWLKLAASAAALSLPGAAFAQGFPSRPIRIVLPYGPTGLPDALARTIADGVSGRIGQSVIVENKPGASGIIAAQIAAKADADGHTLLLIDNNIYGINPAVFAQLPYDPLRDFAPITQAISGPMFLVANAALGVKSVQDLVAFAKAHPGMNYGSPGNATLHHLGMEQLALNAHIRLTHIPYKGVVQAVPALLTGDISSMFTAIVSVMPHVKAGKLVVLAVGGAERSKLMPEIPTVAEAGYPGFEVSTTMGFAAPAATPRPVIERLNKEFVAALKSESVAAKISQLGMEIVANTPEQFDAQIRKDQAHYLRIVRATNLKVE
jgi:tripartite-type tricarboxylate transporter receptor subunit TctC